MDRVVLSWTWENWITVVLMAVIGFAVIGIVAGAVSGAFSSGQ